jgi:lipopolysaccharide biosynthesis glycosyltransferase
MKTLVYSTIGGKYDYLQLFDISFQSLLSKGKYEGDYVVFTGFDKKDFNGINNREKLIIRDFPTVGATWDKFSPFGLSIESYFPEIVNYDKVLYLNVDTIFFSNVSKIFDAIGEGITGCPELLLEISNYHGRKHLSEQDIMLLKGSGQFGINAGILGYRPNRENLDIIKNAFQLYTNMPDGETHEQPALNYCAWKAGKLGTTLGYPLIQLVSPQEMPNVDEICIAHFVCGISNPTFKLNRMIKYSS